MKMTKTRSDEVQAPLEHVRPLAPEERRVGQDGGQRRGKDRDQKHGACSQDHAPAPRAEALVDEIEDNLLAFLRDEGSCQECDPQQQDDDEFIGPIIGREKT